MVREAGFFFFFQAEDGIRDKLVTGVQTCALPIWPNASARTPLPHERFCAPGSWLRRDRKSVVKGKSVDLGGRRIIKKKKKLECSRVLLRKSIAKRVTTQLE